jgi:hypothetical protein
MAATILSENLTWLPLFHNSEKTTVTKTFIRKEALIVSFPTRPNTKLKNIPPLQAKLLVILQETIDIVV